MNAMITDHETTIETRRRVLAYHLLNRMRVIGDEGELGLAGYPPCLGQGHHALDSEPEHQLLVSIIQNPCPTAVELSELVSRTACNHSRAASACTKVRAPSQFNRLAHQHRRRLNVVARLAAEYARLYHH